MGGCSFGKVPKDHGSFNWREMELLEKMFQDLAARSKNGTVTKDVFKCFFNLNGLWAEEIFGQFDQLKTGELSFQAFVKGLDSLVKGSYQTQVYYLFQFYDTYKVNGIPYQQLLKMLYSYRKQQLKALIQDDQFLQTMGEPQRRYIFGNKQDLDPLREVIQQSSSSDDQDENKYPMGKNRRMTESFNGQFGNHSNSALNQICNGLCDVGSVKPKQEKPGGSGQPKPRRSSLLTKTKQVETLRQIPLQQTATKTTPTITLMAKKYATYLFKEFNLDKDKDLLTIKHFNQLISKHDKIFRSYFDGFHQYVWEVEQSGVPDFLKMTSWIEGPCTVYDIKNDTSTEKYVRFYRTTLFLFRTQKSTTPVSIVNLEGLQCQKYSRKSSFGFVLHHRDGLYPQKAYLFQTPALQQEWIVHLEEFMHECVFQQYNVGEKVGSGNYSVVYKGIDRKTGVQAAIKVVQKFKHSQVQKQIIKHECQLLQLTHHQSIINFISKTETKTHLYIITEYMCDGDLFEYVRGNRYLQEYDAANIMQELFSAVDYLNTLGIIHRDLKCENIMIRLNKQKRVEKVKIIDFGFAVYKDILDTLPHKQKYLGTPNYVAPQILRNQPYDQKVDLFSLGVIMYFMLSGYLPFDSLFVEEISQQTVNCQFSMEGGQWKQITCQAKDLIRKLLTQKSGRLTVAQVLRHPWLKNKEDLRDNTPRRRASKYV